MELESCPDPAKKPLPDVRKRKLHTLKHNPKRFEKYGLTYEKFSEMFAGQGYKCKICCIRLSERDAHIDHDHETGVVRGLLCSPCNAGLGMFYENTAVLSRAIAYLENHGARGGANENCKSCVPLESAA